MFIGSVATDIILALDIFLFKSRFKVLTCLIYLFSS